MSDYDAMFFLACLSFMGSSFIVLIWVFFPEVRNDSTTLICCLSGADLLAALMWASSSWSTSEGSDLFCEIQGALIQFADVAIIFWVTCIACHIHAVVLDSPIFLAEPGNKKFGILHLACWSVALVPVIAIASNDCFGTANQRTDGESPSKGARQDFLLYHRMPYPPHLSPPCPLFKNGVGSELVINVSIGT
jgi:hypothetical protein